MAMKKAAIPKATTNPTSARSLGLPAVPPEKGQDASEAPEQAEGCGNTVSTCLEDHHNDPLRAP